MQLNNIVPSTDVPSEALRPKEPGQSLDTVQILPKADRAEISQFPSGVYDGLSQRWQLRPGLNLIIHNLKFREKTVLKQNSSEEKTTLGMSFCLKGNIRGRSAHAEKMIQIQSGQMSLGISNGAGRTIEYAAQRLLLVHLHVQPESIGLGNQEIVEQLPGSLRVAMTKRTSADYFQTHTMTTVMSATVQQLLNCPYHGLSQRLYLESKAIELMSLYFDQISSVNRSRQSSNTSSGSSSGSSFGLKGDEVDRIHYARDILLSQLANPPKLRELAHLIGLNDRKLKQGFRQVFGTTVFGYLHRYRMQQAQQLLLMPKATIASVAQSIGYTNPEAFSVAFRRTFEISPKAYQMQRR